MDENTEKEYLIDKLHNFQFKSDPDAQNTNQQVNNNEATLQQNKILSPEPKNAEFKSPSIQRNNNQEPTNQNGQ